MVDSKRIIIALILGFFAGLLCYIGGFLFGVGYDYTIFQIINVFVNRMLIGFVIGISALEMRWYIHGLVIGEIVGLPYFFYDLIAGAYPFLLFTVLFFSGVFGILIEYFTSFVFNTPAKGQ